MLSADALTPTKKSRRGLSSSALKIIACAAMLIDHVGAYLIPPAQFLLLYYICRIIGRMAFPIFAFCIARGCYYTRNKAKRFLLVFGLGLICELAFWIYSGQLEGNILLTFSCSILVIYTVQAIKMAMTRTDKLLWTIALCSFAAAIALCVVIDRALSLDYGFWGIMVPVLATLPDYREGEAPAFFQRIDRHWVRLVCLAIGIFAHWWYRGMTGLQACAFLALIPLAFYNGLPGKKGMKYAFYIFYPVHLLLIWVIGILLYR